MVCSGKYLNLPGVACCDYLETQNPSDPVVRAAANPAPAPPALLVPERRYTPVTEYARAFPTTTAMITASHYAASTGDDDGSGRIVGIVWTQPALHGSVRQGILCGGMSWKSGKKREVSIGD